MAEKIPVVVLDPGHGGLDPGAIGSTGVQEKVVTLSITRLVAAHLGSAGCKVVLTRASDADVSLDNRASIAHKHNADVFVSIHANAANNPAAHGLEVFHFRESGSGQRLAESILDRLVLETGLENRGVKEAGFAVLRKTDMTAVLVECGFLTNPTEEALLEKKNFQEKCAQAISSGILAFLGVEKPALGNILTWAVKSVEKAVSVGLVANPELLTESEQKIIVWFDRLNLLKGVR